MHKLLRVSLLGLSLVGQCVWAQVPPTSVSEASVEALPPPLLQRQQVLKALRENDGAGLISAMGGEGALAGFLNEGAEETEASLTQKLAERDHSEYDDELLALWTTLAGPDGVAKASAVWYPRWQALVPRSLASAQMGLLAMGTAAAENNAMSALERQQLNELQWALGGWLSRTDFADRKRFEQSLAIARTWIQRSGKSHPAHLVLSSPEQRLQLLDSGLDSAKRVLSNYGLDVDAALASLRFEQLALDGDRARIRTSLKLLDVPLVFEQDLRWFDDKWRNAEDVEATLAFRAQSKTELPDESTPVPSSGLDADPVFVAPPEAKSLTGGGCHAPEN